MASLLAYQKIMSYKQVYEVLAQGDQCGSAVGQQEITKKKKKMRMLVWICLWQWCPGAPGNLLGAGSLCGDNMVTVGSQALSLES